jgi:hypothetical protein
LKPAWANSSARPYPEKTHHEKKAGGVVQGIGPEFKLQSSQKKKEKNSSHKRDNRPSWTTKTDPVKKKRGCNSGGELRKCWPKNTKLKLDRKSQC